ncbi:hypothetical protein CCP3SC1_1430005 [Gammaproteobacteria bacterium]
MNTNQLKRILTTILILVLLGIVLVWPLITGLALERNFGPALELLSEPSRWSLRETEFKRGWFNSEARSVFTLEGGLARQMREARYAVDPRMPLRVTLVHHIHHGPVLSMTRPSLLPAAALVETTVELPQDTQEWLQPLFGQEPPVRLRSLVRLNGEVICRIESAAGDGELKEGVRVHWQGIAGTLEIVSAWNTIQGGLTMPLLELSNDAGQLRFQQLGLHVNNQRHQAGLWLGDIHINLKALAFMIPGKPEQRLSFTGFSAASISQEENQSLHATISLDLAEMSMGGHPLGSGEFTMDLRGVDLAAISTLYNEMRNLEQQSPPTNYAQVEEKMKQAMVAQLPALIRHSPEIGITRLNLRTPQGVIQGKLQVTLAGEEGLQNITPQEIFQRLGVDVELSAPLILVADLTQAQIAKEMIARGELSGGPLEREKLAQAAHEIAEQRLSTLVGQGLLVRYSDRYTVQAKFAKGQINLNGRPRKELFGILSGKEGE